MSSHTESGFPCFRDLDDCVQRCKLQKPTNWVRHAYLIHFKSQYASVHSFWMTMDVVECAEKSLGSQENIFPSGTGYIFVQSYRYSWSVSACPIIWGKSICSTSWVFAYLVLSKVATTLWCWHTVVIPVYVPIGKGRLLKQVVMFITCYRLVCENNYMPLNIDSLFIISWILLWSLSACSLVL